MTTGIKEVDGILWDIKQLEYEHNAYFRSEFAKWGITSEKDFVRITGRSSDEITSGDCLVWLRSVDKSSVLREICPILYHKDYNITALWLEIRKVRSKIFGEVGT